jgi:hypothetical protein
MAKRKRRILARTRTVVVYRDGVVGYYSRDRVEGGISPRSRARLVSAFDDRIVELRSSRCGSIK